MAISFHKQPERSSASTSDRIHLGAAGCHLCQCCPGTGTGDSGRNLVPAQRASAVEGDDHQRTSARSTRGFSGGVAGFSNTRPPPPGLKRSTRLSGASLPTGLWFYMCLPTYTHTAPPVHRDHRLLLCCSREPHVPGRLGRGQARHSCD